MSTDSKHFDYDVVVIGGGASGMMAAGVAAEQGARVLLLEKNKRLGEKLRITGGGRCNITNVEEDTRALLAHYGAADKFLFSAFSRFGVQSTIDFFERLGLPIKVEERKRAFPVSNSAEDVVRVLEQYMQTYGVYVRTNATVQQLYAKDGRIEYVQVDGKKIQARNYILSTGGLSRPETGSTGDGFGWLTQLGHQLREPTPNVTPLAVQEHWVRDVSGVSLKDVDVIFYVNSVRSFKVHGSVLLTHFGISGPIILNNAYRVADLLEQGTVTATIDCYPALTEKELDLQMTELLTEHKAKQLRNTIRYIAPPGLTKVLCKMLAPLVSLDSNNSELSKAHRQEVVKLLKALPLTIDRLMGFEKAVVADGGLSLTSIDTRTMQSKHVANLYITGDLLDINRPSGGFSLQLCWTTAYLAALSASSH